MKHDINKRKKNIIFKLSFFQFYTVLYFTAHILFLIIIDEFTGFAPDELNYLNTFNILYDGSIDLNAIPGWGNSEQLFLQILYAPAKLLTYLGLSSLLSLRILSFMFSYFTVYILYFQLLRNTSLRKKYLLYVFFMPTIFMWTSLALKESFIFFNIIIIFYLISRIFISNNLLFPGLYIIALTSLFLIKNYLYMAVLLACFITIIIMLSLSRNLWSKYLILAICTIMPAVVFPVKSVESLTALKLFVGHVEAKFEDRNIPQINEDHLQSNIPQINEDHLQSNIPQINKVESCGEVDILINKPGTPSLVKSIYNKLTDLLWYDGCQSDRVEPLKFNSDTNFIKKIMFFIVYPIPFQNNGSLSLNFISIESFIWYFFYGLFLYNLLCLFKRMYIINYVIVFQLTLVAILLLIYGLFNENLGTAIRHKSVILIILLGFLSNFRKSPKAF